MAKIPKEKDGGNMITLQEIIDILRLKASQECQPSMDGRREQYYKGRDEAYLECAEILEKYIKQWRSEP